MARTVDPDFLLGNALFSKWSWALPLFLVAEAAVVAFFVINPRGALFVTMAGVGLAIIPVILKKPSVGIYLVLFSVLCGSMMTLRIVGRTPKIHYADVAMMIALLMLALRLSLSGRTLSLRLFDVAVIFSLSIVYWGLRLPAATDFLQGLVTWKSYVMGFLMLLLVVGLTTDRKEIRRLFYAIVLWGTLLATMEFYYVLREGNPLLMLLTRRINVGWGRTNYIAAFYVLTIPITTSMLLSRSASKSLKFLFLASLTLMVTALLVTVSRGGVVACAVAMSVILFRFFRRRWLLPLVGLLGLAYGVVYLNPATRIVITRLTHFQSSASVLVRYARWRETFSVFLHHPFLGVGMANLGYYLKRPAHGYVVSAHNYVLGTLAESGIIGFIPLVILFWFFLRVQIRNCREQRSDFENCASWGILAGVTGAILHSMVEPNFEGFQFSILFWFIVGISVAIDRLRRRGVLYIGENLCDSQGGTV